ncbi:MAG TPA: hypothetical protein PKL62_05860 [Accumulibacter sp.]|uniref:hypothetical protein n=1 Tax=Accumulibacter sp. TaxID=2053492 RepID=UPI002CC1EA48|nr:hypothetical protein [Accumulibacter sp.]HNN83667.1 hypothetical protein [Accumulibacter sp.]
MKIPAEAIPPATNLGRVVDEERKTEPVANLASLANDLSPSLQGRPPPTAPRPAHAGRPVNVLVVSEETNAAPVVERRKGERRLESRPVLLDTRTNSSRRRSSASGRINIKV